MAKKKVAAKTKKKLSHKAFLELINNHLIANGLDNYEFDHIGLKSIEGENDCPDGKRLIWVRKEGEWVKECV